MYWLIFLTNVLFCDLYKYGELDYNIRPDRKYVNYLMNQISN